jgi:manganese-dependent ADP-ribose/CDP-alcohol diphosphatase
LHDDGDGCVVAVLAGHLHRGGYAVDEQGVHHVTLPSPLNFPECYGMVSVYVDSDTTGRLELEGNANGDLPSRSLPYTCPAAGRTSQL